VHITAREVGLNVSDEIRGVQPAACRARQRLSMDTALSSSPVAIAQVGDDGRWLSPVGDFSDALDIRRRARWRPEAA
jgi:hypothetical protein